MMQNTVPFSEVFDLAKKLSPRNKIRLIEHMAPEIERDLLQTQPKPRRSLWGLWTDLDPPPSAEDTDQARREEWAKFLREDI